MAPHRCAGSALRIAVLALALAACGRQETVPTSMPAPAAPTSAPQEGALPSRDRERALDERAERERRAAESAGARVAQRARDTDAEARVAAERASEAAARSRESAPVASPPPPDGAPDAFAAIDRALARLAAATVAFNAPATMPLGGTAEIQVLISLKETLAELQGGLTAPGERLGGPVKVSGRMEARLTGVNFQITAIAPEEQALSGSARTAWAWEVKPTQAGAQRLHLTLTALFDADGAGPVRRGLKTFDRTIEVEVTWRQRLTGFIADHWQWLWAAILVPLATWGWRRRRRK